MGIGDMTISTVSGCNNQHGFHLRWIGQSVAYDLLPRVKLGIVVPYDESDRLVQAMLESSRTGRYLNGGVFVSIIEQAFNTPMLDKDEKVIV